MDIIGNPIEEAWSPAVKVTTNEKAAAKARGRGREKRGGSEQEPRVKRSLIS
jgi:hypothetical protein